LIRLALTRSGPRAQMSIVLSWIGKLRFCSVSTSSMKNPALLMRMSIGPPLIWEAMPSHCASLVTSIPLTTSAGLSASSSGLLDRTIATTWAPASVSSLASDSPMPRLAPVTATRLPLRKEGSYTDVMSRYRWLFSFLARANRAGWSGIEYTLVEGSSSLLAALMSLDVVAINEDEDDDEDVATAELRRKALGC
jgi:hypothetical protein